MNIRHAHSEDIPHLVEMGRKFHDAKQNKYPFCAESTARFFEGMISAGVVFIAEDGFLAGAIAPEPSNNAYKVAHEAFWWSEGRSGFRLRKAFEEWAKAQGCSEVQFSHPDRETIVGRLLKKVGYRPATLTWSKAICA